MYPQEGTSPLKSSHTSNEPRDNIMRRKQEPSQPRQPWDPKPLFVDPLYEPTFYVSFIDYESDFRTTDAAKATELNNRFIAEIPERLTMIEQFLNRHDINVSVGANDYIEMEHFIIENIDHVFKDPFAKPTRFTKPQPEGISDFWASIMIDFSLHILYKKQELGQFPIKWHPEPRTRGHAPENNYIRFGIPGPSPSKKVFMFQDFIRWAAVFTYRYTTKYNYRSLYDLATVTDKVVEKAGHPPLPPMPAPGRSRKPPFILKDYEPSIYTRFFTNPEDYSNEQTRIISQQMIDDAPNRSQIVTALLKHYNINIDLAINNLEELEVFLLHHVDPHEDPDKEYSSMNDQWTSFMIDLALHCAHYKITHNNKLKWKIASRNKRAQPILPTVQFTTYKHFIIEDFISYGTQNVIPEGWIYSVSGWNSLGHHLKSHETERPFSNHERYFPSPKYARFQ
jgi:hypothetical protein